MIGPRGRKLYSSRVESRMSFPDSMFAMHLWKRESCTQIENDASTGIILSSQEIKFQKSINAGPNALRH